MFRTSHDESVYVCAWTKNPLDHVIVCLIYKSMGYCMAGWFFLCLFFRLQLHEGGALSFGCSVSDDNGEASRSTFVLKIYRKSNGF